MTSRYEVTLGGVKMSSLNKNLLILDVSYSDPEISRQEYQIANLDGLDYGRKIYKRRSVTVTFELHIYSIADRNAACQAVKNWAKDGGTLLVNDRSGQYLTVECTQFPEINSVKNWTDPLTIVFSTVGNPYWNANSQKTLTISGTNPKGNLVLDGNIGNALVSADITANVAITSLQVAVGSTKIKLSNISVAAGKVVKIDYVKSRYMRIRVDSTSLMSKLDPQNSTDNLQATCGASNSVVVTASGKVTAVIKARGLFL